MFIASYSHLVFHFPTLEVFEVKKSSISETIVNIVRSATPPSRFLRYNPVTSIWEEIGDKRAVERVSQMLRQNDFAPNTGGVAAVNELLI